MYYLFLASNRINQSESPQTYYLGFDLDPHSIVKDLSVSPAVATPFELVKQWKLDERMAKAVRAYFDDVRIDPDKNFYMLTQDDLESLQGLVGWQAARASTKDAVRTVVTETVYIQPCVNAF